MKPTMGWNRLIRLNQGLCVACIVLAVPLLAFGGLFGLVIGSAGLAGLWGTKKLARNGRRSSAPRVVLAPTEGPLHAETA